ncbi:hypothetical protein I3843_13G016700 [Carya illinoinensis]|nr:hypothetical protein I3843_13G016700 [Carya illinoinensis]
MEVPVSQFFPLRDPHVKILIFYLVPIFKIFPEIRAACISRFKDFSLSGADVEKIEADSNLQGMVDRFIEGHPIIKRSHANYTDKEEVVDIH